MRHILYVLADHITTVLNLGQ